MTRFALLCLFLLPATVALAAPHRAGKVHTADVALGYECYGTGSAALPIIVVNGGPGLPHTYLIQNDLWKRVAAHRLVVLYDQRGTGASRPLRENASQAMDAQVADLEALRAALSLERVAILGDSYGGMIAMAYATAHPEHVARLVLSDSAGPSWKSMEHLLPQVFPDIEERAAEKQKILSAGDPDAAARDALTTHMSMIFYSPQKRDAYLQHMGDLGYVPGVAHAVQSSTETLDLTPSLAAITAPTLVITGRFDMNVAPLTAWRIAHAIPRARIEFFEKSGHLPGYEEPARYLRVLERFLGSDGR